MIRGYCMPCGFSTNITPAIKIARFTLRSYRDRLGVYRSQFPYLFGVITEKWMPWFHRMVQCILLPLEPAVARTGLGSIFPVHIQVNGQTSSLRIQDMLLRGALRWCWTVPGRCIWSMQENSLGRLILRKCATSLKQLVAAGVECSRSRLEQVMP